MQVVGDLLAGEALPSVLRLTLSYLKPDEIVPEIFLDHIKKYEQAMTVVFNSLTQGIISFKDWYHIVYEINASTALKVLETFEKASSNALSAEDVIWLFENTRMIGEEIDVDMEEGMEDEVTDVDTGDEVRRERDRKDIIANGEKASLSIGAEEKLNFYIQQSLRISEQRLRERTRIIERLKIRDHVEESRLREISTLERQVNSQVVKKTFSSIQHKMTAGEVLELLKSLRKISVEDVKVFQFVSGRSYPLTCDMLANLERINPFVLKLSKSISQANMRKLIATVKVIGEERLKELSDSLNGRIITWYVMKEKLNRSAEEGARLVVSSSSQAVAGPVVRGASVPGQVLPVQPAVPTRVASWASSAQPAIAPPRSEAGRPVPLASWASSVQPAIAPPQSDAGLVGQGGAEVEDHISGRRRAIKVAIMGSEIGDEEVQQVAAVVECLAEGSLPRVEGVGETRASKRTREAIEGSDTEDDDVQEVTEQDKVMIAVVERLAKGQLSPEEKMREVRKLREDVALEIEEKIRGLNDCELRRFKEFILEEHGLEGRQIGSKRSRIEDTMAIYIEGIKEGWVMDAEVLHAIPQVYQVQLVLHDSNGEILQRKGRKQKGGDSTVHLLVMGSTSYEHYEEGSDSDALSSVPSTLARGGVGLSLGRRGNRGWAGEGAVLGESMPDEMFKLAVKNLQDNGIEINPTSVEQMLLRLQQGFVVEVVDPGQGTHPEIMSLQRAGAKVTIVGGNSGECARCVLDALIYWKGGSALGLLSADPDSSIGHMLAIKGPENIGAVLEEGEYKNNNYYSPEKGPTDYVMGGVALGFSIFRTVSVETRAEKAVAFPFIENRYQLTETVGKTLFPVLHIKDVFDKDVSLEEVEVFRGAFITTASCAGALFIPGLGYLCGVGVVVSLGFFGNSVVQERVSWEQEKQEPGFNLKSKEAQEEFCHEMSEQRTFSEQITCLLGFKCTEHGREDPLAASISDKGTALDHSSNRCLFGAIHYDGNEEDNICCN